MDKIKYTKITVVTRKEKLEELRSILESKGINGMTVTYVTGNGQQLGAINYAEEGVIKTMLMPKVMVEAIYTDIDTEELIDEICRRLRTNIMGDGKIFIEECSGQVFKIRTGELNEDAI